MKPEPLDKEAQLVFAHRLMATEKATIERHYKLKDLSLTTAKVLLEAARCQCAGMYPDAIVSASISARGKVSFNVTAHI